MSEHGEGPDITTAAEDLLEKFTAARPVAEPLDIPKGYLGLLYRMRVGIEALTTFTGKAAQFLVWVVFILGVYAVVTRYTSRFIRRDIIIGELFDLQWMLFGALVLLGLNYGVQEGVNPRIDFWWADFSLKTKAKLDLFVHTFLFLPFLIASTRVLWGWSLQAMGRRFDGSWTTWRVWEIWEQSTDAGGLPRGPIKLMILIGFILMASQIVAEMIKQILVLLDREDLAGITAVEAPLRVE